MEQVIHRLLKRVADQRSALTTVTTQDLLDLITAYQSHHAMQAHTMAQFEAQRERAIADCIGGLGK